MCRFKFRLWSCLSYSQNSETAGRQCAASDLPDSTATYTAKSLKANISYKFRIRVYKTIGMVTQYSAYSTIVTAKTKK